MCDRVMHLEISSNPIIINIVIIYTLIANRGDDEDKRIYQSREEITRYLPKHEKSLD